MISIRNIKWNGGFTLIELMIVLVVLGILLAIGLPGYSESVRKTRRTEAMSTLMELSARQERFYAQNSSYTTEVSAASGLNLGRTTSAEGHYAITAESCASPGTIASCYILRATPNGSQAKDTKCSVFSFSSLGVRSASGSLGDACW